MVANDEVPLAGSDAGDGNLNLLIAFTRDADLSNRDWATMLLASSDIDTPKVRAALLSATEDSDTVVRGEALQGLAERDPALALPLVKRELRGDDCSYPTFQAARTIAHRDLIAELRKWLGNGGATWIDAEIGGALAACEAAVAQIS